MFENEFFDDSGEERMKLVLWSVVVTGILLTVATTVVVYAVAPDWGFWAAVGIGVMVGFWICPLTGGVAGNGIAEAREARREGESHASVERIGGEEESELASAA